MVFPRDLEGGKKICQVLSEKYAASLILFEQEKLGDILRTYDLIVAVMAVGILVRSICHHLNNKWTDTPLVAVDSSLSCAVPVIGGHHGANELAQYLAEQLDLFPAVTTATDSAGKKNLEKIAQTIGSMIVNREASKEVNLAFLREEVPVLRLKGPKIILVDNDVAVLKNRGLVLGLGTRKGVSAQEVLMAVDSALEIVGRKRKDLGAIATAWLKRDEKGISEAAEILGKDVIYLTADILNVQIPTTQSRAVDLGLAGVAEPAVLAIATKLIMPKRVFGRVTVALGE
ncbi:MAG: cobalt-precorrin 5A hydrolase [Methanotrichaceae archaeon]|nr:cobalt-precorrin 5A hydrolase [Methanotrichaceae archaeon]